MSETQEIRPRINSSAISIRPYFDPHVSNMGLENYGLSLFDGTAQVESLACLEVNGIKRYVNGLNEFAPEVKLLPDAERKAKVKEIRTIVADIERSLASNILNIDDVDFWSKVQLCQPNNSQLWDQISVRCSNDPVVLYPNKDPYDLIKVVAIEAGGFSIIAKSLEAARKMAVPPKFYLDKLEDTSAIKTEIKKLKAKAMGILQKMFDGQQNKMFLVAKVVDMNSVQYKKSTPSDVIYDNLYEHIEGNRSEQNKRKAVEKFLDVVSQDMETIKIRAIIKDAVTLKLLHIKADGYIYHMASGTVLGKNTSDVQEYLKNPLHEEILKPLTYEVDKYWNQ